MTRRERAQQLYDALWEQWSRNHDDWDPDNMIPIIERALVNAPSNPCGIEHEGPCNVACGY